MAQSQGEKRSWLGWMAFAVTAACKMLVNLFSTADEGIDMLASTVRSAREQQAIRLDIDGSDYLTTYSALAATRQEETRATLAAFVAQDPSGERAKRMNEAQAHLLEIGKQALARVRASRLE